MTDEVSSRTFSFFCWRVTQRADDSRNVKAEAEAEAAKNTGFVFYIAQI